MAYFDETQQTLQYAYKENGNWQVTAVPGTNGETVTSLSLALGFNSRLRARIAYTTGNGALRLAVLYGGVWQTETVESSGAALGDVSLARDSRLHLAYVHTTGGLQYAFRTASLDVNTSLPSYPTSQTGGDYNPLDPARKTIRPVLRLACSTPQDWQPMPSRRLPRANPSMTWASSPA